MNTTFENITRRLDINPATQDDSRNKDRSRAREIKKLQYTFVIPTVTGVTSTGVIGSLLYQFNYTATHAFKIIDSGPPSSVGGNRAVYCVKYRVGPLVYRWRLPMVSNSIDEDFYDYAWSHAVQAARYAGELIQPNFTIELWCSSGSVGLVHHDERIVTTNRLVNPTSMDDEDTTTMMEVSEELTRADLVVALPETLPTVYISSSSWEDN